MIWFTQVGSSHQDKLMVPHNKAVRITTGCHLKIAVSHLRAKTGVLILRAHLELSSQQLYGNALKPVILSSPDPQMIYGQKLYR